MISDSIIYIFIGPIKSYTTVGNNSIDEDVNFYEREIEKYMQESLDSTQRSRRQLEQSEQIGIATAQVCDYVSN